MGSDRRLVGIGLIAISAGAFGSLPVFARATYDSGAEPLALLFLRFAFASVLMVGWMVRSRRSWPRGRLLVGLALLGGVGYVGQSFSYFTALTLASASLVALLLYLYPALVTLLSAAVDRKRIDRGTAGTLLLALIGCTLVIGVGGSGRPAGVMLGLAAAAIYAVYIVAGSRITPAAGAIPSTAVVICAAAAVFGVVAVATRPSFPGTTLGWSAAFGLAVMSVIAIVAFFEALERLGPSDASTLSTLEPVVTVVLAALLLGEEIMPLQMLGGALVLTAGTMLARRDLREHRAQQREELAATQP